MENGGRLNHPVEWREVSVPVPWGVIAGREVGDPHSPDCWFALHGWLDNCGTFTRLAPLILGEKSRRIICIDLPGHGHSSHYPPGMEYNMVDAIIHIRRVASHLKLSKFSLLGHSMGGMIITLFAATHPEMVRRIVVLDVTSPFPKKPEGATHLARKHIDAVLANEALSAEKSPKVYSMEGAKERMFQALNKGFGYEGNMTRDGVDCLFPRAVRPLVGSNPDQYVFTRDMRLYVIISSIQTFTKDVLLDFASNIDCPHLIVRCRRGLDAGSDDRREAVQPVLDQYVKSNTRFRLEEVDSTHHAHLTEPETVASAVNKFLLQQDLDSRMNGTAV